MNILDQIVAQKRLEIADLYQQHDIDTLRRETLPTQRRFYLELADCRSQGQPFFITEFKRKSPSEGWIAEHAEVAPQVRMYAQVGARAISVLTDTAFFGGKYDDLRAAEAAFTGVENRPLLLQKDFVLDPIQIYLARQAGADLILLIAAILPPDTLDQLRTVAESLGMGALVEVHDEAELADIQHLDFKVLGVNNRDLKTFRTSLNRVNVVAQQARGRFVIAESGVYDYRDFAIVRKADGFLIGTSLMRGASLEAAKTGATRRLFKACGIRTAELWQTEIPDFIGINFSPVSKRRMSADLLNTLFSAERTPAAAQPVALFYQNSETEILETLKKYPFRWIQLYAGDVSTDFIRHLRGFKVMLAVRVQSEDELVLAAQYAPDVDLLILDSAQPGSGTAVAQNLIPTDYPYPFLLAGGIHAHNLDAMLQYDNCIGIDTASGIETDGAVDPNRLLAIRDRMNALENQH